MRRWHSKRPSFKVLSGRQPNCDFTEFNDIARRIEYVAELWPTVIFNLGTGENYRFNTVVEKLNEELGRDIAPRYIENSIPEDVYVHGTCADITKVKCSIGREPEIGFDEGVRRVCADCTQPSE